MQNIVMLAGNIGQAPEARTTQGGTTITNFTLATSRPRLSEGRVQRDENGYFWFVGRADDGGMAVRGLYVGDDIEVFNRAAALALGFTTAAEFDAWVRPQDMLGG
mgnify:CR=1 FL=1